MSLPKFPLKPPETPEYNVCQSEYLQKGPVFCSYRLRLKGEIMMAMENNITLLSGQLYFQHRKANSYQYQYQYQFSISSVSVRREGSMPLPDQGCPAEGGGTSPMERRSVALPPTDYRFKVARTPFRASATSGLLLAISSQRGTIPSCQRAASAAVGV